jgi:metallo-beta-lactamase class B
MPFKLRVVASVFFGLLAAFVTDGSARAQQSPSAWLVPARPAHIVGPIYFVGTIGLANYLIKTPAGLILIDGGMPQTAQHIEASIRELGFRPKDIKYLLITHAHIDHAGATAYLQGISGATVKVMDRDHEHLTNGGTTDPVYGKYPPSYFPAVTNSKKITNGSVVRLGGIRLKAHLGAGHTPGATTWVMTVKDGKQRYKVAFVCCTGANPRFGPIPGHRLVVNPSYCDIAGDYRRTFRMLARLNPDIWLGSHTEHFDFWAKRERAARQGVTAWLDRPGYELFLKTEEAKIKAKADYELFVAGKQP